jgi:methyl halide transferase
MTDKNFWENRWSEGQTGWDLGKASPPIKAYIDTLTHKNIAILIPGCGNAYEAEYLLQHGFTNVTVIDIAPTPIEVIKNKLSTYVKNGHLTLLCNDFFTHVGQYDLVLEQTFFCAINPAHRKQYAEKMHALLKPKGKVVGLMFNKHFEGGPPFGGNQEEYQSYFSHLFSKVTMQPCLNSILPRAGAELWVELIK